MKSFKGIFTDINGAIIEDSPLRPEERPNRWGIGLSGGYGYSLGNQSFAPYIGIGIQYNLIEF